MEYQQLDDSNTNQQIQNDLFQFKFQNAERKKLFHRKNSVSWLGEKQNYNDFFIKIKNQSIQSRNDCISYTQEYSFNTRRGSQNGQDSLPVKKSTFLGKLLKNLNFHKKQTQIDAKKLLEPRSSEQKIKRAYRVVNENYQYNLNLEKTQNLIQKMKNQNQVSKYNNDLNQIIKLSQQTDHPHIPDKIDKVTYKIRSESCTRKRHPQNFNYKHQLNASQNFLQYADKNLSEHSHSTNPTYDGITHDHSTILQPKNLNSIKENILESPQYKHLSENNNEKITIIKKSLVPKNLNIKIEEQKQPFFSQNTTKNNLKRNRLQSISPFQLQQHTKEVQNTKFTPELSVKMLEIDPSINFAKKKLIDLSQQIEQNNHFYSCNNNNKENRIEFGESHGDQTSDKIFQNNTCHIRNNFRYLPKISNNRVI